MNGFDVRALGWVITRDVCTEIVRTAFRGRPRMPPAMLRELSDSWRAVESSLQGDWSQRVNMSVLTPVAAPLSKAGETAIMEFVDRLAVRFPHLYGEPALRSRCLNGCAAVTVSAAASAVLVFLYPSDTSVISDAGLVLLVIAFWKSITTLQLCRTYHLVKRILRRHRRSPRTPATQL